MVSEGDLLWTPSVARRERSHIVAFMRWLERERGLRFADYQALWQWSVQDLESFWGAIWDYCEMHSSTPFTRVLGRREMPGAEWFTGARLNYAERALKHERPDVDALMYAREEGALERLSWTELAARVRLLATQLRKLGVRPGDRVVAVLPNSPQAVIALLATTAIGAVWSCCGPDFGRVGVLERFQQLEPKVIFHVDGYQYGGKRFDRKPYLREILAQLTTVEHVIAVPYMEPNDRTALVPHTVFWPDLFDHPPIAANAFEFEQVPSIIRCGFCSLPAQRVCRRRSCTATAAFCSST